MKIKFLFVLVNNKFLRPFRFTVNFFIVVFIIAFAVVRKEADPLMNNSSGSTAIP